ncbi:hypothetical protein CAI21_14235 [Alkalilimnicola ehrlichii]|uniref:HTH tetR-type domain-containing protein n=1 Tax=Alkalilimnicola ehrlichii TaxID=351052 RepID=A0A3E0WNQ1_9GAMM|nr:TetR/AcrR family transcriptional regulator [Alkalilimnicola ehrlichii]RFA27769.1 hypothetical protein CAI21_14235 [Alkalilimnicola ehrlichii]RFA33585.1 hypothetical protein CAL65_17185 [Alkalilimnicola ehrlichii]
MPQSDRRPGRASSRDKLLDAAADLVVKHGVQNLTIDSVAAAAGVTKAGLIYHFKTRDELLSALVERMVEAFDVLKSAAQEGSSTTSPKAALSRLLNDTLDMPQDQRQLLANLLVAVCLQPSLAGPVQALYARDYEALSGGDDGGRAMLLAAAMDGIALIELLHLHKFTSQQRQAMRAALEREIRELP